MGSYGEEGYSQNAGILVALVIISSELDIILIQQILIARCGYLHDKLWMGIGP